LHDKFARDDICGFFRTGVRKLVAYQIGEYFSNGAKADVAAATAHERPIVLKMIAGMFKHPQAKAQTSVFVMCCCSQHLFLPINEFFVQLLEPLPF